MATSQQTATALATGSLGGDYIDDTSTHSVDLNYQNTDGTPSGYLYHQGFKAWAIIEAVTDCVINTLTVHEDGDDPDWDLTDTLTAGSKIRGLFTVVDLTSGTAFLHRV